MVFRFRYLVFIKYLIKLITCCMHLLFFQSIHLLVLGSLLLSVTAISVIINLIISSKQLHHDFNQRKVQSPKLSILSTLGIMLKNIILIVFFWDLHNLFFSVSFSLEIIGCISLLIISGFSNRNRP